MQFIVPMLDDLPHRCTMYWYCPLAIIVSLLFFIRFTSAKRGQRINIEEQDGGDIKQPLEQGYDDIWFELNALPRQSEYKWDQSRKSDGLFRIPYVITGQYDDEELDIIWGAMKGIERNTCIRFEVRKSDEADFVEVQNKIRHGCYAAVGRMPGRNVLMLEANNMATCIEHDIVVHELMHTIGLWHEHMRRDRDEYIKIHSSYISQFDQVPEGESDTYGIRYNYRSLMHYGKNAFAKRRGLVTIETIDPAFQDVIGRAQDAAPSDYYKICSIYDCGECMGKTFSRVQPDDPHRRSLLNILMETTIQPPPKAEFTAKNSVTKPEASNSDHNFDLFESIFSFFKRLFQKSDR